MVSAKKKKSSSRSAKTAKKKKSSRKSKTSALRSRSTLSKRSRPISKSRTTASSSSKRKKSSQASKKSSSSKSSGEIVVRIMGEGQYRLDSTAAAKLNEIDNEIVKIVQSAHHDNTSGSTTADSALLQRFHRMLGEMTSLVKRKGREVPAHDIIPSDLILPPKDTSIEEARELFEGEGLIPS